MLLSILLTIFTTMYLPVIALLYSNHTVMIVEIVINAAVTVPVVTWVRRDCEKRGKKTKWWTIFCAPGFSNFLSLLLPVGIYYLATKRWVRGVLCLLLFAVIGVGLNAWLAMWMMAGAA